MKDVKFRGKRSYDKKWVYGSFVKIDNKCHIIQDEDIEEDGHHFMQVSDNPTWVDEETVGQLSGLTDKNGKEIYEGDIVNYDFFKMDSGHHQAKILFQTCYSTKHISNTYTRNLDYIDYSFEWLSHTNSNITIIGNIHDNPELLTEK